MNEKVFNTIEEIANDKKIYISDISGPDRGIIECTFTPNTWLGSENVFIIDFDKKASPAEQIKSFAKNLNEYVENYNEDEETIILYNGAKKTYPLRQCLEEIELVSKTCVAFSEEIDVACNFFDEEEKQA